MITTLPILVARSWKVSKLALLEKRVPKIRQGILSLKCPAACSATGLSFSRWLGRSGCWAFLIIKRARHTQPFRPDAGAFNGRFGLALFVLPIVMTVPFVSGPNFTLTPGSGVGGEPRGTGPLAGGGLHPQNHEDHGGQRERRTARRNDWRTDCAGRAKGNERSQANRCQPVAARRSWLPGGY